MKRVNVPGIGEVDSKWLWVGAAVVAAGVGWSYWRNQGSAGDGVEIIEEGIDGAEVPVGDDGWGNRPGQTGDATGSYGQDIIDTVPEWTAEVVSKLATADWDTGFVYTTIGKWIAGEGLTDAEKALVRAAIAAAGQPPGGPYPLNTALPGGSNPPPPPPAEQPATARAEAGVNLYEWANQYGGFVRLFGERKQDPNALNPSLRDRMVWKGPKGTDLVPQFTTAQTVKIR